MLASALLLSFGSFFVLTKIQFTLSWEVDVSDETMNVSHKYTSTKT